jgi:hypothetical protein
MWDVWRKLWLVKTIDNSTMIVGPVGDAYYFSIEAALSAKWWDCAPIWADTDTIPNASIQTITIVANAIVNGRAFRSSIMRSSYRPLLRRFRNIAASPNPPPFSRRSISLSD